MKTINIEFPHPVLDENIDDYSTGSFKINLIKQFVDDTNINIILNYELTSEGLKELVKNSAAQVIVRIESSAASFRKIFVFGQNENEIIISLNKNALVKNVDLTGFIIATQEISKFHLPEHNSIYFEGVDFRIRKGDILAQENGQILYLDDSELEKQMPSIFTISEAGMDETILHDLHECNDKIKIILNKETYNLYYNLRRKDSYKKYLSGIIVLPVLIEALSIMKGVYQQDDEQLREGYENTRWFKTIEKKLEKNKINLIDSDIPLTTAASKLLGDIVYEALLSLKETEDDMNSGETTQMEGEI